MERYPNITLELVPAERPQELKAIVRQGDWVRIELEIPSREIV